MNNIDILKTGRQLRAYAEKHATKQNLIRSLGAVLMLGTSAIPNFACDSGSSASTNKTDIAPMQKVEIDLRTGDNTTAVDTKAIGNKAVADYLQQVADNKTFRQGLIDEAKRQLIAEAQKKLDEKGFASAQPEIAVTTRNAHVNGVEVDLSLFNEKDNPHELYRNATGINAGKNYKLDLPEGWSAITASLSAEIQREGGEPVANTNSPVIIIIGPFVGGAGLWEGAIYIVPTEWLKAVSERVLVTQRQQTGKPELQITPFNK